MSLTFFTTADKPSAMTIDNDSYHVRLALVLIGLSTVARLFYAQGFLLSPDETNYWQWSRYLDWGYHDQTPMIAWAIRLGTMLCGHTELGVRLPSIVAMAVASLYLMMLARRWFGTRVAWHTTLLGQSILVFNIGAVLATADGLQGAAWVATSYHVARAFEADQWRQWVMGGIWFGFGLLSKYTMVVILPLIFLFGLLSPLGRRRLASNRPYLGCILGLLLFVPVVAWNYANDWNSFRHVAYLGGANQALSLHFKYLGEFLGSQMGLLTPLPFGLMAASWFWVLRRWPFTDQWIYGFLFFTSFPVIAGFAAMSLHTRVYGNWPCNGYLTATILCAALWAQGTRPGKHFFSARKAQKMWRWSVGSAYCLTALVMMHVYYPILPIPKELDRIENELLGWDQLGHRVAQAREQMPPDQPHFIFGLSYQMASELAFYVPGQPKSVSINRWHRPNVYDYWWNDSDLAGQNAVGVLSTPHGRNQLLEVFEKVDPPIAPVLIYPRDSGTKPIKAYFIYRCYGFKGGLRWIPKRANDVRSAN